MNTQMNYQKYWDACLIRSWRQNLYLKDLFQMFEATTNKRVSESGILRIPTGYFHLNMPVRGWVNSRLEKISNRLWSQDQSKDLELLRKLETSNYTTSDRSTNTPDNERSDMRASLRKDKKRNAVVGQMFANYYHGRSDWGIMKEPRIKRTRGARK